MTLSCEAVHDMQCFKLIRWDFEQKKVSAGVAFRVRMLTPPETVPSYSLLLTCHTIYFNRCALHVVVAMWYLLSYRIFSCGRIFTCHSILLPLSPSTPVYLSLIKSWIVNLYIKASSNKMSTPRNGTNPYSPIPSFPPGLARKLTIQIYVGIASFAVIFNSFSILGRLQLTPRFLTSRYSYGTSSSMPQMNTRCSQSIVSLIWALFMSSQGENVFLPRTFGC